MQQIPTLVGSHALESMLVVPPAAPDTPRCPFGAALPRSASYVNAFTSALYRAAWPVTPASNIASCARMAAAELGTCALEVVEHCGWCWATGLLQEPMQKWQQAYVLLMMAWHFQQ
jgi:hypothetical protein